MLPFPFSAAFVQVGNPVVAGGDGHYQFIVSPLQATSQFRTLTRPAAPTPVVSPTLTVRARVKVSLTLSTSRPRRGHGVRFSGSVRPAKPGLRIAIQRRGRDGVYRTSVRTALRAGSSPDFSSFGRSVTVNRSGGYWMSLVTDGAHYNGTSDTRLVSVR